MASAFSSRASARWFTKISGSDHQVISVYHFGAAAKPEDREDIGGGAALDLLRIDGVVGHEAAPDLDAIRTADDNSIPAGESAVDADDASGQEAAAALERRHRAGVDGEHPLRLKRSGDPFLARRHKIGGGEKPGAARAVSD